MIFQTKYHQFYQAMIKAMDLEDYLSSCSGKDITEFLKTKCNSDMCNNDKDSIFLSKQGHFRKPLKITLKCSTNKGLCSQFAKSTSSKVEDSINGRLTCKKNTFENFDSMKSLRCSWNNTTLEQVQCMENIHKNLYSTTNIMCCTKRQSTLFRISRDEKIGASCDERKLLSCGHNWSSWSHWQVGTQCILNKKKTLCIGIPFRTSQESE